MAKTISDIYTEYKIMGSLQEHMLRVAAVASVICDNYVEPIEKEKIIIACLLHDMGNIIKSDLKYFPEFLVPEGLEYWQRVQNEYLEKYGKDEHCATFDIIKELGLHEEISDLVAGINFSLMCDCRDNNNLNNKIINYCDNRVDPHGVVSFQERIEEALNRYKNREHFKRSEEERCKLIECGLEIEKQIFAKCKIRPEDINNETVASTIKELRNFVIK